MFRVSSDQKQSMSMFSESAFYYSFYTDVVNAGSIWEGIQKLLYDWRSEYPDALNALRRFNVYQELLLGVLWRVTPSWLMWFSSAWNFYASIVFINVSVGVGALAATAALIGGSAWCGMATLGFFLGNFLQRLILRTSSVPLRENWGTPLLWVQILSIVVLLRAAAGKRDGLGERRWWVVMMVSTFSLILVWQFSVFILTTQTACLYALLLVGYPVVRTVTRMFFLYSGVFCLSFAVQFFPRYLLLSILPLLLVSVVPVLLCFPPVSLSSRSGVDRWWLVLAKKVEVRGIELYSPTETLICVRVRGTMISRFIDHVRHLPHIDTLTWNGASVDAQ
eukprot:GHVS01018655.1.p1 GENE.GHVS01018655.1~~GHVS01018655.1.p1  ORF type:complete len:344 (+),score=19.35 GHVS01018655.1:30-1034(+)